MCTPQQASANALRYSCDTQAPRRGTVREPRPRGACRGAIKPDEPLRRDGWMTDAPEAPERVPAYMAQKSVTAFSDGASKPVEVDPSWTALPGAAPSNLLKGGHAVVQPQSDKDAIAAKNDELMSLAAREARANAEGAAVRPARVCSALPQPTTLQA